MKKINLILFSLLFLLLTKISSIASEKTITGFVKVIDGDSIKINGINIRLFGIDAPEMKQVCKDEFKKDYYCGAESKNFLERSILLKLSIPKNLFEEKEEKNYKVWCNSKGKDRYGRVLGICGYDFLYASHPNNSLNGWMVKQGYAVAYKNYSKMFIKFEDEAKKNKKGIWKGEFDMPWDWRKKNR